WLLLRLIVWPWRRGAGIAHGLGFLPPRPSGAPVAVWCHAVSVGELASVRPVLTLLRARHPDWWILLTVIQPHALRLATERPTPGDAVARLPLDPPGCVERGLARARPDVLVLVECELWPQLIARAAARGARVMMMNARIYARSLPGYLRIRP